LLVVLVGVHSDHALQRPSSYLIRNAPYHRQINDWSCGDASLEMALHFTGPDVDQRAIVNVARADPDSGTLSYDLVRAGHFSNISRSCCSQFYPKEVPKAGWNPGRPLGLASFLCIPDPI